MKPSQYDDEGHVWQFRWGVIPNNTLTVLAGITAAYAAERALVEIETILYEELFDGPISAAAIDVWRRQALADGVEEIIALAGVQTGQYCRGRDLALQFLRTGFPVVFGGFHVSSDAPSREFLRSAGVTVVVGEAESTWPRVLDDYLDGRLQLSYAVRDGVRARTGLGSIEVPAIDAAPLPVIDTGYLGKFFNPRMSTLDTSRGCPFACTYCAVKNVMGRTMRSRRPSAVVDWLREAYDREGVGSWFIVDDDLYRSPTWEDVLSGIVDLRQSGRDLSFMMQCDVEAAGDSERARRFVDLCAAAGCYAAFIGFESFHPRNLDRTRKFQNQEKRDRRCGADDADAAARVKEKYRHAVERWHAAGVAVHAGYMIGLPFDGPGSGRKAAADLSEIGVDLVSFFPYTPLPGTEDYSEARGLGAIVEDDFNRWDCLHVVHVHPTLKPGEVYREYRDAHRSFYSARRLAWSLLTRHGVRGLTRTARDAMLVQQLYYTYAYRRGWHPMMGGLWRRRDRSVRREAISDDQALRRYLPGCAGTRAACGWR